MNTVKNRFPYTGNALLRRYWLPALMILVITALHYLTPHGGIHNHTTHTTTVPWYANLHGIYRRLYYFPIILAAFRGGLRGGAGAALLVVGLYLPHATGRIGHDPGTTIEKFLEMALYMGVGILTGVLVQRIDAARDRLQRTASDLSAALAQKTAMEAELVRSARLAAVGRLSAGLAHEIRNPLASIQGAAEVLSDDFPPQHPKGGLLRIMLEEAGRLNQVLTKFLGFARSEPGEFETFDLLAEAEEVKQLLSHQPDMPRLAVLGKQQVMARGNREQIRQVVLNLTINAGAAAGPAGQVSITVTADKSWARVLVCDNGPGFSAEARANFGTPFYSTKAQGTGLGLATSLRIVEDFGGSLGVVDDPAGGGCVEMKLPLPAITAIAP